MFSYNNQVHIAHSCTFHEAFFGRKARIPSEFAKRELPLTVVEVVHNLFQRLSYTQTEVTENQLGAKEKYKTLYDRFVNAQTVQLRDPVLLLKEPRNDRVQRHYLESFYVIEIHDGVNVRIQMDRATKVVHTNELKHFTNRL